MSDPRDDEAYWRREKTEIGRRINDVKDRLAEAASLRALEAANPSARWDRAEQIRTDRADKTFWRGHFKATGEQIRPADIRCMEAETDQRERNSGPSGEIVEPTHSGKWRLDMSGIIESRVHIGRSEKGYHYGVESTDNRTFESDPPWSEPFKTGELARAAASAERQRINGEAPGLSSRREAIDPATGKDYTVDVYPDGQGQKVNVRDNDAGTVIQTGAPETLAVTMDEGERWVETEARAAALEADRLGRPDPDPEHLKAAHEADLLVAGDYERDPDFDRDDDLGR